MMNYVIARIVYCCTLDNRYSLYSDNHSVMAERSPGDNDDHEDPGAITDSSPDSRSSSLHVKDNSFKKAEMFQYVVNG